MNGQQMAVIRRVNKGGKKNKKTETGIGNVLRAQKDKTTSPNLYKHRAAGGSRPDSFPQQECGARLEISLTMTLFYPSIVCRSMLFE